MGREFLLTAFGEINIPGLPWAAWLPWTEGWCRCSAARHIKHAMMAKATTVQRNCLSVKSLILAWEGPPLVTGAPIFLLPPFLTLSVNVPKFSLDSRLGLSTWPSCMPEPAPSITPDAPYKHVPFSRRMRVIIYFQLLSFIIDKACTETGSCQPRTWNFMWSLHLFYTPSEQPIWLITACSLSWPRSSTSPTSSLAEVARSTDTWRDGAGEQNSRQSLPLLPIWGHKWALHFRSHQRPLRRLRSVQF